MTVLGMFGLVLENVVLLRYLGATCVLLFGFPDAPFSQPRNIVSGHVISAFIGPSLLSKNCGDGTYLAATISNSISIPGMTSSLIKLSIEAGLARPK